MNTHASSTQLELQKLANGMPLLTMQTPGSQISSALYVSRAGSRHESKEMEGISRFYSIMSLKRSRAFPQQLDISVELDRLGAFINIEQNREYSAVYVKAYNEYFADAVRLLGEMVAHPIFDPKDIEDEKKYFSAEIQNRFADQNGSSLDELFKLIFPDQGLAFSGIGDKNAVSSISESLLQQYHEKFHTGLNSALVLNIGLGAAAPADYSNHIESYFGALPMGELITPDQVQLNTDGNKSHKIPSKTGATSIAIGFPAYSRTSPHRIPQQLMDTMLSKTKSNVRFANITIDEALARSIGSSLFQFSDGGVYSIQIFGESKTSAQAHQRVLDEIEKISMTPVSEEELERAKGFYSGMQMISVHDPIEASFFYAMQLLLDGVHALPGSGEGSLRSHAEFISSITSVTVDEVQGVAQQIFNPDFMYTAVIGE